MDMSIDRPARWLQWARETFGEIALDPHERALRFVEEAVELVHAIGLDANDVSAIIARVYERPAGNVPREVGQCLACFETLALVLGVDADHQATGELARVKAVPQPEWAIRHGAKVALGIAKAERDR